jgi:hypothetical protein
MKERYMIKLFLFINSILKKAAVCYLLSIAFFIPPVNAQKVKTQVLPNLTLLKSRKMIEKNKDINPNLKLSFANEKDVKRKLVIIYAALSRSQREKESKKKPNFPVLTYLPSSFISSPQNSYNLLKNKILKKDHQGRKRILIKLKNAQNSRYFEGRLPPKPEKIKENFYQSIPQINDISKPLKAETLGIVELTHKQKNNWWYKVPEDSLEIASNSSEIDDIENRLNRLPQQLFPVPLSSIGSKISPGFTISNPSGYGADNNIIFVGTDFQSRTRFGTKSDGEIGFGIGLGDAVKLVGVELAYTLNTLGSSQDIGSGSFSIKIHRRIAEDIALAVGWNQFADILINPRVPFDYPKNSYYIVLTKLFKTQEFIDQLFSRMAVTVGVGSGQFLSQDVIEEAFFNDQDPTGLGVFASLGVRIFEPVSMIIEWTGQDLGAGISIVPFKNIPLVITPAFRDIIGAGNGTRFIIGTGVSFQL